MNAVAFDADGSRLASAGADGTVWVWEVSTLTLAGLANALRDLAFSPDGNLLASAS